MKNRTRVLSWLLAIAMLTSMLPLGAVMVSAEETNPYGRGILAQMDNAEALLYVYDTLEEAFVDTPDTVSIAHETHKISWDELQIVYPLVLSDHPEIFWHGTRYGAQFRADGTVTALKPTYTMTGTELNTAKAQLEKKVVQLTSDLAGKSDYEKSLILHDRLAAEAFYTPLGLHQTAYGALVQGTAVCAGYAHAYQLLMQRVGIPTWYVTGTSVSPAGVTVPHAWNLVQLDGAWYYTDVTWDDQPTYTFYAYLNTTTAQITEDHTFGDFAEYLPTATATANNYFVRNNLQMEAFDVDAVAEVIANHNPSRMFVTGDKSAFIKDYAFKLYDLCDALEAPPGSISYGYHTLGREVILRLDIGHTCVFETQRLEPTCNTDGYTVQTCTYAFCHQEKDRTVLPATGMHVYDNPCDASCNLCGGIREVGGHVYDNPCDASCNLCGGIREVGDHVYDNPCDASCNLCGGNREVGGHVYDNPCDASCNLCGGNREVGGHVYDNAYDETCNICDAHRTVPEIVSGDTDGDGALSLMDAALMQRYLNHWDERVFAAALDFNGDGATNNKDLVLLIRLLNSGSIKP